MFSFINWLKAIATILITNSHYADIWPVSAMAAGGHLGNCLFFLVSGFCMCHIKESFPKWYAKRILRIYPALWLAIAINLVLGFFSIGSFTGFLHHFFYPTWYHFITSIMLLYLLFYPVRTLQKKYAVSSIWVILITLLLFTLVYLFRFDSSYYHLDAVEENWVRFQFWISMMAGAHLRESYARISSKISVAEWILLPVLTVVYFAAKIAVSRYPILWDVQFLSPLTLLLLVIYLSLIFIKLEKQGRFASENRLNPLIRFLSSITLEIYLVQNVIIGKLSFLPFPANFLVVTALILTVAWAVHWVAVRLQKALLSCLKLN